MAEVYEQGCPNEIPKDGLTEKEITKEEHEESSGEGSIAELESKFFKIDPLIGENEGKKEKGVVDLLGVVFYFSWFGAHCGGWRKWFRSNEEF